MEIEIKPKATPKFGQSTKIDFCTLLKKVVKKEKPNIKLDKREHRPNVNTKKEKNLNSNEKLNLVNSSHIKKELAIERWFCDYPNKRLMLRNDYDQDHSIKFLLEKEIAFEKLNFYDDLLLNNDSSDSN